MILLEFLSRGYILPSFELWFGDDEDVACELFSLALFNSWKLSWNLSSSGTDDDDRGRFLITLLIRWSPLSEASESNSFEFSIFKGTLLLISLLLSESELFISDVLLTLCACILGDEPSSEVL